MRMSLVLILCLGLAGCSSWGKKQRGGTAVGAAAGGAAGAVLGNKSGKSAQGAAIGAAIGGTLGSVLGRRMDQQAKELDKVADSERTDDGIITKLKGDILFDTGRATLKPEAVERLNQLSDIIKKYPEDRLTVVGHTDSTGGTELNQDLSEQRAQSVRLLMLEKGIPEGTVSIVGMGEAQPVGDNDSTKGRAQNRRVELKITADPESIRQ
jgi:outer membrane protein OmpA-like peptidoglycan-associated protein